MKKLNWVLLIALNIATGLFLAGCTANDADRPGTQSGTTMSDSDLEESIKNRWNSDLELQAADLDVDADASNNEIRLSGTVSSEEMRNKAVEMVKIAHPGLTVQDSIEVKSAELSRADFNEEQATEERRKARESGDTIGSSVEDAWIHMKVTSKLITDGDTPARKINVDVQNGVVTLRGTVDSEQNKTQAQQAAMSIEGVKNVNNLLKVGAASEGGRESGAPRSR
jgi:hyperosmotically inducible protein